MASTKTDDHSRRSASYSSTSNFDVYLRKHNAARSDTESGHTRSASVQSYQSRISDTEQSGRVAFCAVKNCDRYAELYCDTQCQISSIHVRSFEWKGCNRAICHKHSVIRHDHGNITMCRKCEHKFELKLAEREILPTCSCFSFFKKKPKHNPEKEKLLERKRKKQHKHRRYQSIPTSSGKPQATKARKSVECSPGTSPPRYRSVLETPPKPKNVWKKKHHVRWDYFFSFSEVEILFSFF